MSSPNLLVFDTNLRSLEQPGRAAFCRPGFEQEEGPFRLNSHRLSDLLEEAEIRVIDARPRIVPRPDEALSPAQRLVDLEHARLRQQVLPPAQVMADTPPRSTRRASLRAQGAGLNAASHWRIPQVWLTGVLPQQQPFRDNTGGTQVDVVLLPDEEAEDYALHQVSKGSSKRDALYVRIDDSKNHCIPDHLLQGARISIWGTADYMELLRTHAEDTGLSLMACAQRYGTVSLLDHTQGWRFHPALGFTGET